ncbi:MAG: TIGR03936 family radical SAM-associated protein [Syntrophomonadaceae bacterium]|nr:TIGR03936 family radical SAM-associated protein [Syntrophomonadaceae bacterium]
MLLRAEYRVGPELKFLANLDMMHLMARELRRGNIPYALSEGFNPHIKLSMGTVLPVGLWGEKEYFDLELNQSMALNEFMLKMKEALPPYIEISQCWEIGSHTPSLMKAINAASYVFVLLVPEFELDKWREEIMAQEKLLVASRGKKKGLVKDLRKGIYKIELDEKEQIKRVEFWVSVGEPLNVRYDELEELLHNTGVDKQFILDVYRSSNYVMQGQEFFAPLEKVK